MEEPWGLKVKRLRLEKGLTQDELAAKSGVPASHISRIEHGKQKTGQISTARKLAHGLNVDVLELIGGPKFVAPVKDYGNLFNELRTALPPPVKVFASLADALVEGGKSVCQTCVTRRTPEDDKYLFGIQCSGRCLPLILKKNCVGIIDKRETVFQDGNLVMFENEGQTCAGVYHVMGEKRWADNILGSFPLDGKQIYKVVQVEIDTREGLD